VFLGLTFHCARCHDHKFDAVSQKDYYRLAAALAGVGHGERPTNDGPQRMLAKLREREAAATTSCHPSRRRFPASGHRRRSGSRCWGWA
jgi:hypothetical protein